MIIAVLSVFDLEAAMLQLADPAIVLFIFAIEPLLPPAVMKLDPPGGHPLYPILNLLTSLAWGLASMLVALLVAARRRRRPASNAA